MYRLVLYCVFVIAVVGLVKSDDDGCYNIDDEIEQEVLQPLRQTIKSESKNYISLQNHDYVYFGIGMNLYGGRLGDFSQINLQTMPGNQGAAVKCTVGIVKSLTVNGVLGDIALSFKKFGVYLPYITIGDVDTTFTITGVKLNMTSVSTSGDACTSSFRTYFDDDASFTINFNGGLENSIIESILNRFINPYIMKLLKYYHVDKTLFDIISQVLDPFLSNKDTFCPYLLE